MRRILKRVLTLFLVLLCFCTVVFESGFFTPEASAATTYYQTAVADVVVRAGPSSGYEVKKTIATKGTVVKVVDSTTNSSGNLWYQLSDGYWVFSERLTKHSHSYTGGICTGLGCGYEWAYKVTSVSKTGAVTNTSGCAYYNRPYSKNSTNYGKYSYNSVLTITGETVNQEGNTWYKTNGGYWVYSGNITEIFTLTYNANGGKGAPSSQNFLSGQSFKLSSTKPTRVGYIFMGWSSTSTSYASNTAYHPAGGSYTAKNNVTLNAIWKACSHSSYSGGICETCKYEYPLTVESLDTRTYVVTNSDGCPVYNRPYSNNSTKIRQDKVNTVMKVVAQTENQAGNLWYQLSDGYWIYSGNVTRRYTVKYDLKGGSGSFSSQTFLHDKNVVLSSKKPAKVGYTFQGWANDSDSSVVIFEPGDTYYRNKDLTLYAVWKKCGHSSYTGGICNTCKYEYPLTVTELSKRYYTVTNADGCAYYDRPYSKNSTKYGTFANNKVLTIVAKTTNQEQNEWYKTSDGYWVYSGNVTQRYTVKYNANGGENAPSTQYFLSGKTLTLSKNQPVRVGYVFKGWATSSSSTTVSYKPGASYSTKKDLSLYAVWSKCSSHSYTGGICTKCSYEYPLTISAYKATFIVTNKDGAKNWSRPYSHNSTNNSTSAYGAVLSTAYKTTNEEGNVWYQLSNGNWVYSGNIARGYWLQYDANGGSGAPTAVAKIKGTQITLSSTKPTKSGYTFLGWSTSSSGSVDYKAGSKYTINGGATLYAVWAKNAAISSNPSTTYVKSGATAKFSASATGTGLKYQWQYRTSSSGSWANCTDCTAKTVNVSATTGKNGFQYRCKVTDTYGNTVYSKVATLYVLGITEQPKTTYTKSGATAKASVSATGSGLTYTWYYKNANDTTYSKSSVTEKTYSATMDSSRKDRRVYCVITDKAGNTVQTDTVILRMAATITTQPKNTYTASGSTAKITVKAVGDGLTYTWYIKNAGDSSYSKSSVTGATYATTMRSASKDRLAYCVVKDQYGNSVQTQTVVLRMAATITTQPKSVTAANGSVATTTVKAVGDGLTYTWYVMNPGSSSYTKSSITSATYSCKMSSSNDGRKVYCVVTDSYGRTAKTDTVTLNMK